MKFVYHYCCVSTYFVVIASLENNMENILLEFIFNQEVRLWFLLELFYDQVIAPCGCQ